MLAIFGTHEEESVYVAPGGGWIEFTRNATTDALVAEPLRSFGLGIVSNGAGGYVVNGVLEGFSAAEQGVRAGDVVLQVNGVSVDTVEGKSLLFGPAPLRAGQADFLIPDAAGGQRTVTLTARVMLE